MLLCSINAIINFMNKTFTLYNVLCIHLLRFTSTICLNHKGEVLHLISIHETCHSIVINTLRHLECTWDYKHSRDTPAGETQSKYSDWTFQLLEVSRMETYIPNFGEIHPSYCKFIKVH